MAWAIGVMRYNGGIKDWTNEELQDMDRETINIMTLNRCLHPRSSVARLYMKWKEGGRWLITAEDHITTEKRGLYDYLKEIKEDILSGALKENVIQEGETKEKFKVIWRYHCEGWFLFDWVRFCYVSLLVLIQYYLCRHLRQ